MLSLLKTKYQALARRIGRTSGDAEPTDEQAAQTAQLLHALEIALEDAGAATAEAERSATAARERADAMFNACQAFEKQRDEWLLLYKRQALEHGAAQAMLERSIASAEAQRAAILKAWNDERQQQGLEIRAAKWLDANLQPDNGIAERFLRRHLDLFEEARERFGFPAVERPRVKSPCSECGGSGRATIPASARPGAIGFPHDGGGERAAYPAPENEGPVFLPGITATGVEAAPLVKLPPAVTGCRACGSPVDADDPAATVTYFDSGEPRDARRGP